MTTPTIKSGKFYAGKNFQCGDNVVIDVAEEVRLGDNCVLGDNAYLGGRRIVVGDHFYGYSWEWRRLDIGRTRRDCEFAVLTVGDRCTFHDNRIDLSREVLIGNDVGLSPEVAIYTHHYWMSALEDYPCRYKHVIIGGKSIIGFRAILLAGAVVPPGSVVGAGAVVTEALRGEKGVFAGNPAKRVKTLDDYPDDWEDELTKIIEEYEQTRRYRGIPANVEIDFVNSLLKFKDAEIDILYPRIVGKEDEDTDDLRDFLFRHGIRIYTDRPFRRLPKR